MRIGIDARPLSNGQYTGIPYYTYMILTKWMKKHPEHEYYLFSYAPICWTEDELPDNWHIVNEPWVIKKGSLWFLFKVPSLIKRLKLDAYWGPNYSMPFKVRGVKYYVTIHDLGIYHFKHIGQRRNEIQIKIFLPSNIRKSEKVIAISDATKHDIMNVFGTESEKITTIYNGGLPKEHNNDDNSQIREQIKEIDHYFLFIGTIEPRKNIPTIIKAYELYCEEAIRQSQEVYKLIIAGGKGWNCDAVLELIEHSKYRDNIVLPGYIDKEEKKFLLENASCFVYPSLCEGFGIPVLEAFQYNVPVITAYNSSLPEVGGDAAYYVDAYDVKGMANLMSDVLNMTEEEKEHNSVKMKTQLEKFSWEKCAEETLNVMI